MAASSNPRGRPDGSSWELGETDQKVVLAYRKLVDVTICTLRGCATGAMGLDLGRGQTSVPESWHAVPLASVRWHTKLDRAEAAPRFAENERRKHARDEKEARKAREKQARLDEAARRKRIKQLEKPKVPADARRPQRIIIASMAKARLKYLEVREFRDEFEEGANVPPSRKTQNNTESIGDGAGIPRANGNPKRRKTGRKHAKKISKHSTHSSKAPVKDDAASKVLPAIPDQWLDATSAALFFMATVMKSTILCRLECTASLRVALRIRGWLRHAPAFLLHLSYDAGPCYGSVQAHLFHRVHSSLL